MATRKEIAALQRRAADRPAPAGAVVETVDNIIDFVTSPHFLGQRLYPGQGTVLKAATLRADLFTDFDLEVLDRWGSGFGLGADQEGPIFEGDFGTTPDVLDRIQWCRDQGQPWVSELLLVLGRRGSKNFVMSLFVAWGLWRLLSLDDPQSHYELPADKVIACYILGANLEQVIRNAFKDIGDVLNNAPCFRQFLGKQTRQTITILTPAQLRKGAREGIDYGSLRIIAAASTPTSVRGPAVACLVLDEIAHVERGTSSADSVEMYRSARAALGQFPKDRLIIQTSSPWQRTGQLYLSHQAALRVDPSTGRAAHPEILAFQLPSPALYEHADRSHELPVRPNGPTYGAPLAPKITWETVNQELDLDPVSARVEFLAHYANVQDAYLTIGAVNGIFAPYNGEYLTQQRSGTLATAYFAHADPARVNDNFALAVGHVEPCDDGVPHVVFDVLRVWSPRDFPNHTIDYTVIERELFQMICSFGLTQLTFDQWNSGGSIDRLIERCRTVHLPRQPQIFERTATHALNWKMAQVFKTAANQGVVHAPGHDLARSELEFLTQIGDRVDHPSSGPVQTKDLADAMINVTYALLSEQHPDLFARLSGTPLGAAHLRPGPPTMAPDQLPEAHRMLANLGREAARRSRPVNPAGIRPERRP